MSRLSDFCIAVALVVACALVVIAAFVPMWPAWEQTR